MQVCEEHYESWHVWACRECKQVLSSEHFLDLHLQEAHDSYFKAAVERHKAQYRCVVETCPAMFSSIDRRLLHLQQHHGYPKWFRFLPKSRLEEREIDVKKKKWMKKRQKVADAKRRENMHEVSMEADEKRTMKRQQRKQARKDKRAKISCRFYSAKEGCWRGITCDFLHETAGSCKNANKDLAMVIDMDCVANDFEAKASLLVPDHIVFGLKQHL